MTNYNERPDDLTRFMKSIGWEFDENGYTFEDNYINFRAAEMLRQAITSLIKELVGEREYSIEIYLHDRNGTVKMKKETVKVMSPRNIFSIPIDNYRRVKVVVQELTKEEGNQ